MEWVNALHHDLHREFYHLSILGVKFNLITLKPLAFDILMVNICDSYSPNMMYARTDKLIHSKITLGWIQSFTNLFRIVIRAHTGKNRFRLEKKTEIV